MDRVIDLTRVARVLDNISEVEYDVAIKREEDLWYTHRNMRDRILFLENCGVVTKEESQKMLVWSENEYKKNIKKVEKKEAEAEIHKLCDVGF